MMAAERGAATHTLQAYRRDLKYFAAFATRRKQSLTIVDKACLEAYMAALTKENYAARSIARKLSALRQFFHFLYNEKIRTDDPSATLEGPRQGRSLPNVLSAEAIAALLTAAYKDTSPEGLRLTALLELLYASGLRVSELVNLKLAAVQSLRTEDPFLSILGKGNKERLVPVNPAAIKALQAYLKIRPAFMKEGSTSPWLFPAYRAGKPLTRQHFATMLKALAEKAGIDPASLSPHTLRHSFASHLLAGGADLRVIQELLGHADIATTQIYTHVQSEKLTRLVQDHHPLSQKKHRKTISDHSMNE